MLAKLKTLFQVGDNVNEDEQRKKRENDLRLACSALMMEVATIDGDFDSKERLILRESLQAQFSLSDEEAQTLSDTANDLRHDATSLHEFTRLINEHCTQSEKFSLVESMWKVAYADGHLDKYEEHIVRRAADLIHLSHSDFIRAKLAAKA